MERCKDCGWWNEGECLINSPKFRVDVKVADDHGLDVKVMTEPDFGCTEFKTLVEIQDEKANEIIDEILAERKRP